MRRASIGIRADHGVLCHLGCSGRRSNSQQCGGRLFKCGVTTRSFTGPNARLLKALMKQAGLNKHNEWNIMSKAFSHRVVHVNGHLWLKDLSEPLRRDIAKFVVWCRHQIFRIHSGRHCHYFQARTQGRAGVREPHDWTLMTDTAREKVYAIPETAWKDGFKLPPQHVSQEASVPESVLDYSTPDQSDLTLTKDAQIREDDAPQSIMESCGGDVFQCRWANEALSPAYGILTQEHKDLVNIFLTHWGVSDSWQLAERSFTAINGHSRYDVLTVSSDGARKVALFIGWCRYWIGQIHEYKTCSKFRAKTRSFCSSSKAAAVGCKPKGLKADCELKVTTADVYRIRSTDWRNEELRRRIDAHKEKYRIQYE